MTTDAESVLSVAERWQAEGHRVAWATVTATWRSSPRPAGSQMIIADDGRFAGSVSGGCVEAAVIAAAERVFEQGEAQQLAYGVSSETAWDVGLPCGGKIEISLALAPEDLVKALAQARQRRVCAAVVSDLESGAQVLWEGGSASPLVASGTPLARAVEQVVESRLSQRIEVEGRRLFVLVASAAPRLIVVGAVHLTQVLAELADLAGFELVVVDPRTAFASSERFPRATLVHEWPREALEALSPDAHTAVVVLSHDAKLDEPALEAALRTDCFYIGALGSRRTQEVRRRRLEQAGFGATALARIHGPVGLDIGATTTPEMAISIMAEIIRARRGTRREAASRAGGES